MPTLTWVGKDKVVNHHLDVPFRVLQRESHFDAPTGSPANSTDNRIIHGDNLAALKSLLPEFEGKINCIYIDPPYNTGNESWVYNDAVNDPKIKKWLGQVVGKEGEDLSRHDKWLCMMYPRLKLLHRLLAKDGVIFISIDDNEQAHLRLMCDEIFGERNFRGKISRATGTPSGQGYGILVNEVDYIFVFSKSSSGNLTGLEFTEKDGKIYDKEDEFGKYLTRSLRKTGGEDRREDRPTMYFGLETPDGEEIFPISPTGYESRWRCSFDTYNELKSKNLIEWKKTNDNGKNAWKVYQKFYLEGRTKQPSNLWQNIEGNKKASIDVKNVLGAKVFDTPKPIQLIEQCIQISSGKNAIILDSFAGSGTTAHAVLKLNAQDGGNRRFILIEMEDYADTITAERVRRVMSGYGEGNKQSAGLGGSFDYYTVGAAIFNPDDTLNEAVGVAVIRDYVSYSEGIATEYRTAQDNTYTPYLLGLSPETAWIFYYELDAITCLDLDFLGTLKFGANKPATAIIYADKCLFNKEFLSKHGIIFKKIPRDITRF
jgi:adenine-specific DNA-methyltransferase